MTARTPQVGDTITTAEELDQALTEGPLDVRWFLCVSTPDRGDEIAWTCFSDADGDVWAVRPASEDDSPEVTDGVSVPMTDVPLPITIVATSDARPRPEREVKAEALREAARLIAEPENEFLRGLLRINSLATDVQEWAASVVTDYADRIARGDH